MFRKTGKGLKMTLKRYNERKDNPEYKNDKMYYIFGGVDEKVEELRKKINAIIYIEKRKRNIKKYELLNALVLIGLEHLNEVLDELGLMDISEKELKDEL
jgi:hypothetical protein